MSGSAAADGGRSIQRPLILMKWGGGLITDKTVPESVNRETLERLAIECVAGMKHTTDSVVLGHGSGSFGHWAAKDTFLSAPRAASGRLSPTELQVASATADAASRLHREVITSLLRAGAVPFSWIPSTAAVEVQPNSTIHVEALGEALDRGFLPVTQGDVVLSRETGASIWSTERVFESLVDRLFGIGFSVRRILWLGNTDGVFGSGGQRIDGVDSSNAELVSTSVGGSAGVDVTGGMRLRFETCRALAQQGVESWVLDGRVSGVLESALSGVRVGGTSFSVET